jgi:3D (Asp-Asp-Asp) domain-containing protein
MPTIAFGIFSLITGFSVQTSLLSVHMTTTSQVAYPATQEVAILSLNDSVQALSDVIFAVPQPETHSVTLTAYSSSEDETDNTPFITASGKHTREGIVAANFLPFGTRIQIPALFGDKIFIVEDRMHPRKTNSVDIWMSSKKKALRFGIREAEIVVLEGPSQIAEK